MKMKINTGFMKRRYTDVRFALAVFAPIIAYSNFILIAYNFTDIKDILPFYLFAPVFTIGLIILLGIVGILFRTKQQSVDLTLGYERSVEANRTALISMEHIADMGRTIGFEPKQEYIDRLEYLRKIVRQEL